VAVLAVAALQSDHLALLSQVLSYFFIGVPVLRRTKAFVRVPRALAAFNMPLELGNSVDTYLLESSTAMTDLDPVYDVLE
jgi:hypothetical protein